MNELSLFTGIGGGLLGTKLLGWEAVGYVEWDQYCCRVLEQRIKDGILDDAPIFHLDIREFNRRIAAKYRGVVDVLSAGFPCQPFSVAGKRRGDQDERNMWPATIECIRLVRPRHLLLENVPGLLVHDYVRRIYGDLAESGYHPKWRCLSAAEVGANHKRNRWWVVAHTNGSRLEEYGLLNTDIFKRSSTSLTSQKSQEKAVAGSTSQRCREARSDCERSSQRIAGSGDISNSKQSRLPQPTQRQFGSISQEERTLKGCTPDRRDSETEQRSWWSAEPDVGRLADGIPNRVDRLKAIGNGQVPLCLATAYALLSEEIAE